MHQFLSLITLFFLSSARDCAELFSAGFKESGVYTVNPTNKTSFEVYCYMKTDGGGWTVFHKRFNGFVGFYRDWDEYKNGFGDVRGEYWLGNEKIHQLTEIPSQLRVEINTTSSGNKYAKYSNFTITNEATNYTLFIDFYSGSAGDYLTYHKGMAFTTKDRDNDKQKSYNCAVNFRGAWWFKSCGGQYSEWKLWRQFLLSVGLASQGKRDETQTKVSLIKTSFQIKHRQKKRNMNNV